MIASKPVRLLSLAIVALVVLAGVRGIVGSIGSSGDLFEGAGADSVATGQRTSGVVAYVVDGDTVDRQLVVDRTAGCDCSLMARPSCPISGRQQGRIWP